MLHDEVDKLIQYAGELLETAEHEAERSEEDVVTHLICHNSRQALVNYYTGFLMKRKIIVDEPVTLQSLLNQCRAVDARFENVDMAAINCRCKADDDNYCIDLEHVSSCMKVAQHVREVVTANTPGY